MNHSHITRGLLCLTLVAWATPARGQIFSPTDAARIGEGMRRAIMEMAEDGMRRTEYQFRDTVRLTPAAVTVDAKTMTASINFVNQSGDTVLIVPTVQFAPLPRPQFGADALLATDVSEDSLRADSLRTDSLGKHWSLTTWVRGLPESLWLAPHEKRVVPIRFELPAGTPPGEYSGHVIATTAFVRWQRQDHFVTQDFEAATGQILSEHKKQSQSNLSRMARSATKVVLRVGAP